jgi:hypothetical protein
VTVPDGFSPSCDIRLQRVTIRATVSFSWRPFTASRLCGAARRSMSCNLNVVRESEYWECAPPASARRHHAF